MKKTALLIGTACGTILGCVSLAAAQTDATATFIPGISKTTAAAGNAAAAKARTVKIPLKSTYSESVITRQVIESTSPVTTAQQLLAREPSIYVTNNGPNGVNQNITFRAFGDGEFGETYRGVPLNDPFNAGVTSQADNDNNTLLTKNDFESIDIYRGINNPAVNTYNSLGGTINFEPRLPSDNFGGEVGVSYGSFNSAEYHATLNTGLIDGLKQLFSFQRNTSDGWTQLDKDDNSNLYYSFDAPLAGGNTNVYGSFIFDQDAGLVNQSIPVDLLHEYGSRYQYAPSAYIKQNSSTAFFAMGGVTQQFTDILSGDLKAYVAENDYSRTSFSNPADQQAGQNPFANPNMIYYLNDSPTSYPFWLPDPSYNPGAVFPDGIPGDATYGTDHHLYAYYSNTIGLQPSFTLNLPFNTLRVGGNLTVSHLHSREYWYGSAPVPQIPGYNNAWDEHDYRTEGSVYVQDDISLLDDRLKITPGAKYLWAETKDHDDVGFYYSIPGSVSNYGHYLSPTIGASYELLPGLDAYAAFGENIKFPDISAYYNNISVSGPNGTPIVEPTHAQPEYVKDYEVGLRYENGGLTAEADYYQEDFTNTFITATDPVTGVSRTTNGGSQRYEGEEAQLGDEIPSPFAAVPGAFAAYVNFAHNNGIYTSAVSDALVGSVTKGQPIGNVPDYLVSSGISWTDDGYFVGLDTNYVGRQYINNAFVNLPTASTDGSYFLTNLALSDTVPVRMGLVTAMKFSLNIDNLFGVHYYTSADIATDANGNPFKEAIVGAPRGIFGSVTAKF